MNNADLKDPPIGPFPIESRDVVILSRSVPQLIFFRHNTRDKIFST